MSIETVNKRQVTLVLSGDEIDIVLNALDIASRRKPRPERFNRLYATVAACDTEARIQWARDHGIPIEGETECWDGRGF